MHRLLCLTILMGVAIGLAASPSPATGVAQGERAGGDTDEKAAARRRAMERQRAEEMRQRAEQRRRDDARRQAEEQARMRARLRAEDGRRRAAARARIKELTPRPRAKTTPRPPLRTLERVERAAIGVDHVPPARSFRVHYDAGVCTAHYVTTINPFRYRLSPRDQPLLFDPLAPYSGVVRIPSGTWTVRD